MRDFMKLTLTFLILVLLFNNNLYSQEKIEEDIEYAVQNAKKGIYWALSNIPVKKAKIEHDLISNDKLNARVRLFKEVNGVKVESTGYYNTNQVTVVLYRSYDSLKAMGYIKGTEKIEVVESEVNE